MSEATRIPELFGSLVFNERTMEQYVPQSAMDVWRGCLKSGQPLPLSAANEIADAMKTWALEHGATHFTHWFQPLSGVTAEKHDSFINNAGGGRVMMDFSGKDLDAAMLAALKQTNDFVLSQGKPLDPMSKAAYEDILAHSAQNGENA